jgi:hypothetical protein
VIAPDIPRDSTRVRSAFLLFPEYSMQSRNVLNTQKSAAVRSITSIGAKHFAVTFYTDLLHIYELTANYGVRLVAVRREGDATRIQAIVPVQCADGMYIVKKSETYVSEDDDDEYGFGIPFCLHYLGTPISDTVCLNVREAVALRTWILLGCFKEGEERFSSPSNVYILVPRRPLSSSSTTTTTTGGGGGGEFDFTQAIHLYVCEFGNEMYFSAYPGTDTVLAVDPIRSVLRKYDLSKCTITVPRTPIVLSRTSRLICARDVDLLKHEPIVCSVIPFKTYGVLATHDPNVFVSEQRFNVAYCDITNPDEIRVSIQCLVPGHSVFARAGNHAVSLHTELDALMFGYEYKAGDRSVMRFDIVRRPSDLHRVSYTTFITSIPAALWLHDCSYIPVTGQ